MMTGRRRWLAPRIRDCAGAAVRRKVHRCIATVAYHFTRGNEMALIRSWPATLAALALVTANAQQNLPGTKVLVLEGDPAVQMVEGIHSFLDRETVLSRERREKRSSAPDRETFRRIIGATDRRVPTSGVKIDPIAVLSPEIARGPGYRVYAV